MQSKDFKDWLMWNAGGGAAILAVLLLAVFLVGSDLNSRSEKIDLRRADLEARLQSLNSLIALRAGSDRAGRLLPKLQEALPSRDQLINFSKFIETQARQNRLEWVFVFESETPATKTVPGINEFSLSMSGTYADFVRFLKALESSAYYVNISTLDIAEKEKNFEILMKGKVFSQ